MLPLNVVIFAPVKKKWRAILDDSRRSSLVESTFSKEHYPTLVVHLLRTVQETLERNVNSCFHTTGIFKYNLQRPLSKLQLQGKHLLVLSLMIA